MNCVVISGNLTKDIEMRLTASGVNTCNFTVAVRRGYKNADGGYDTDFVNCVAWRQTAEFIGKYFKKGQAIAIKGVLQTRTWDDDEGKKHFVTEVKADEADFLGAKKDSGESATSAPEALQGYIPAGEEDVPF